MKNWIINNHWTDGGTGLTNFPPSDLDRYQRALALYGKDDVVILRFPMQKKGSVKGDYSLHCKTNNASAFWRCFEKANP